MMPRIIILLSLFHLFINNSFAQTSVDVKAELLSLEKSYFYSKDELVRNQLSFQKVQLFVKHQLENEEECYEECKRVNAMLLQNMNNKSTFYWNAAIVNMLHKDYVASRQMLEFYSNIEHDTSIACELLSVIAWHEGEEDGASEWNSTNTSVLELNECLKQEEAQADATKTKYNWTSYFVPGSGMMLKGYYIKGASSLLLTSSSALFIYYLIRQSAYINAVGIGLLTVMKFYQGNIIYTKKLVPKRIHKQQRKQMNACHQKLEDMLKQYPINFK